MPQVPVIDSATFITPLDEKTGEDLGGGWSRMNPTPDIGWKQRLTNFDRAFALLADAMANGPAALNQLKKEGVIQRFEYCFELAWKPRRITWRPMALSLPS